MRGPITAWPGPGGDALPGGPLLGQPRTLAFALPLPTSARAGGPGRAPRGGAERWLRTGEADAG